MADAMQPQQQGKPQSGGKITDLVNETFQSLSLMLQAFSAGGAPAEAVKLLQQSLALFQKAIEMAAGGSTPQAEAQVSPEAGANPRAMPAQPMMRS